MYMTSLPVPRTMLVICICPVYIERLKDKAECEIRPRNGVACNWMNSFKLHCSLKSAIARCAKNMPYLNSSQTKKLRYNLF